MACALPSCGTGMPRRAAVLPTGEQCLRIRAEADQRGGSLRAYGDASEVRRKLGECCCGVEASRSCLSWQFGRHQPLRVAIRWGPDHGSHDVLGGFQPSGLFIHGKTCGFFYHALVFRVVGCG